jgi:hypothetical protein
MPALGYVYWRGFLRRQLVSINVVSTQGLQLLLYLKSELLSHNHFGSYGRPIVEVDHVFIEHANAAR